MKKIHKDGILEPNGEKEEDIEAVSNDEDAILAENSADEKSYLRKKKLTARMTKRRRQI